MKKQSKFINIKIRYYIVLYIVLLFLALSVCIIAKYRQGSAMSDIYVVMISFSLIFAGLFLFFSLVAGIVFGIIALFNASVQSALRKKKGVQRKVLKLKLFVILSAVYLFSLILTVVMNLDIG